MLAVAACGAAGLLAACGRPPSTDGIEKTAVVAQGSISVVAGKWDSKTFTLTKRQPIQVELELDEGPIVDVYVVPDSNVPSWDTALNTGKRDLRLESESALGSEHLSGSFMSQWQVTNQGTYVIIADGSGFGTVKGDEQNPGKPSVVKYKVTVK